MTKSIQPATVSDMDSDAPIYEPDLQPLPLPAKPATAPLPFAEPGPVPSPVTEKRKPWPPTGPRDPAKPKVYKPIPPQPERFIQLARHWGQLPESEDDMAALIEARKGVVRLIASDLKVPMQQVYDRINSSPRLQEIQQREEQATDANFQLAIREGVARGDLGWSALWARQRELAEKSGKSVGDGGLAQQAIDFSKEVRELSELSDAELLAAVMRRQGHDVADACPVCGTRPATEVGE